MELFILNKKFELQGILENYTFFKWVRRFYQFGEFELHCRVTDEIIDLLQEDNLIFKKNDSEVGFIETIQLKIVGESETIIIKGKLVTAYLNRRINWGRLNFNGTCEDLMRKLVYDNAINPTSLDRKIPNLTLGEYNEFLEVINYQNSFGNILQEIEKISVSSKIGYKILFDFNSKTLIFTTYKGIDRTCSQTKIAPCIFSRDFENILSQELLKTNNNYKNTCLIAGAGENENRKITSIESESGLSRYELFVDARDLSDKVKKTSSGEEVEIEMDAEEYKKLLLQRGTEKLSELKKIQTFNSIVNTKGNNKYKIDYDLGDFVTLLDSKWKIQINTQITEIEEIYENGKVEINPVFGDYIPAISKFLRRF